MSRVLCLGRLSRALLAFAAAFVLCLPPGLAGLIIREAQREPASTAVTQKSCCGSHDECATRQLVANEAVRPSCCKHSDAAGGSKPAGKSCCGGMGGCGCPCCPSLMMAVVPPLPFEWSSPVLEQACRPYSFILSSRRDVPPTPPPNVA
jgi:hypothetical protein